MKNAVVVLTLKSSLKPQISDHNIEDSLGRGNEAEMGEGVEIVKVLCILGKI